MSSIGDAIDGVMDIAPLLAIGFMAPGIGQTISGALGGGTGATNTLRGSLGLGGATAFNSAANNALAASVSPLAGMGVDAMMFGDTAGMASGFGAGLGLLDEMSPAQTMMLSSMMGGGQQPQASVPSAPPPRQAGNNIAQFTGPNMPEAYSPIPAQQLSRMGVPPWGMV